MCNHLIAMLIKVAVLTFHHIVLPPLFHGFPVAVSGVVGLLRIVDLTPVVVVTAFGLPNLGHPTILAAPNACFVSIASSFVQLVGDVFVGSSTDILSNDDSCSHSSSRMVFQNKKMEHFDSSPNLCCSIVNDTSVLAMVATTNHCRKRCPRLSQGRRRHTSQAALSFPVVRQIRWAAADQYQHLHLFLFHNFPVVVTVFGLPNLEPPRILPAPNACFVPIASSFVELVGEVFVGSSIDNLSNDDFCIHSSSRMVFQNKKMEHFDSSPNLCCSIVNDTSVLAMVATTNHCRKRCPRLSQGRRRHTS